MDKQWNKIIPCMLMFIAKIVIPIVNKYLKYMWTELLEQYDIKNIEENIKGQMELNEQRAKDDEERKKFEEQKGNLI